jgi:hypothetical protein
MSKFQREVDEYKKQIQQSGGAYYASKSKQSIQKPSWMTNKKVERSNTDHPLEMSNTDHPLGGYRLGDLSKRPKPMLGSPLELPEYPITGNFGNKAVSIMEDILPFLESLGIGLI